MKDHNTLKANHNDLKSRHETLKKDYDKLVPDFIDLKNRFETLVGIPAQKIINNRANLLNTSSICVN